jgi:hypothetical protein
LPRRRRRPHRDPGPEVRRDLFDRQRDDGAHVRVYDARVQWQDA